MVRGNNKRKGSVAGLGGLSGLVGILSSNFCGSVYTLFFLWNECPRFKRAFCVCEKFQNVGRRRVLPFEGI